MNRGEIIEQVGTGIVVVLISANERAQCEYRVVTQQPSPGGCDIESLNLRSLVGWTQGVFRRVGLASMENVVEAVRILEPRTCKAQIYVERIRLRYLIIDPVEYVLFIPLGVDDSELRRIKKPATVQTIH